MTADWMYTIGLSVRACNVLTNQGWLTPEVGRRPGARGVDRAERVWVAAYPRRCRTAAVDPSVGEALFIAEGLELDGLCRVVVLDLDRVERAP